MHPPRCGGARCWRCLVSRIGLADAVPSQRAHENLTDATDEVALAGDEEGAIKLLIGEAFMTMEEDAATEFLERLAEVRSARPVAPASPPARLTSASTAQEKKERIAAMEAEAATLEERKKELKRVLYGRFGASINLEE